jgi:hypothetical protein
MPSARPTELVDFAVDATESKYYPRASGRPYFAAINFEVIIPVIADAILAIIRSCSSANNIERTVRENPSAATMSFRDAARPIARSAVADALGYGLIRRVLYRAWLDQAAADIAEDAAVGAVNRASAMTSERYEEIYRAGRATR